MTEHTPTPWRVEEGTDLIWGACNPDDQSSYGMGYPVIEGKIPRWKPYKPSMDEREANAAFIVKAVNNHDALVKDLADAVKLLHDLLGLVPGSGEAAYGFVERHMLGDVGSPSKP